MSSTSEALYRFLRPAVEYATRCHYASVSVHGIERLPREGGYIMAPCHQNGMMEPLLLLLLTRRPIYHICRGDIFANPVAARALHFLKILPIFRRRDGLQAVRSNDTTFRLSQQMLVDGYPLSMMAEGRHNDRHQLLPLVKGMFRIALSTQRELGTQPLYIVPIGIDLDDYEQPHSHAVLNIGEPIDTRHYLDHYDDEPSALNAMRDELTLRLKDTMHNIDSQRHYDEFYALCHLLNGETRRQLGLSNSPYNRFVARQHIARRLDSLERAATADPASAEAAELSRLLTYADERRRYADQHHCKVEDLDSHPSPWRFVAIGALSAMLIIPHTRHLLLWLLLCNPLPLIPTHLIVRRLVDDTQFRSTINFALRLTLTLLYLLTLLIVVTITRGILPALLMTAAGVAIARVATPVARYLTRGY